MAVIQATAILCYMFLLAVCIPTGTYGAGGCEGIDNGESCGLEHANPIEAQTLHLLPGEQPRDSVWGGGLIEKTIEVDVLVAGGGSAGTSAALAAARSGSTVVLANGRPVLGGNAGSEIRTSMAGACGVRSGSGNTNAMKLECREGGIVEEYQLDNAVNNPDLVPELFSLELLTLMKAEPTLTLFQNTWLVSVTTRNNTDGTSTITSATLEDQGSQRRYIVKAKSYVDATGDGRLGAEAGAEWIQGREGASKYNESLAKMGFYRTGDDGPDHETEGTSVDYWAEAKPAPTTFRAPFWASKFNKSEFQYRGVSGALTSGYWWNEVSWPYNTITDGENVTQEALANIIGIWDYLKNSGDHPESANMGLTWVANVGCKREGRRFVGQYVMNQNDVMKVDMLCVRKLPWCPANHHAYVPSEAQEPELYWDRVAYAGWPFDLHNPKGMRDPTAPPFTSHKMPYMFSTPLRSLISKDLTNLFFAGRLASFSHVVYGSQRVMKTCATMGQAAGTAAAYAVKHRLEPIALKDHPDAVWSIQQQLMRDDAFIIGLKNTDPRDHARTATVTASSEQQNGTAANIITGQSRAVTTGPVDVSIGAGGGVPFSQGVNGTNRWISQGLPASISLALAKPTPVKQVQLVFDTGMHRHLAWSMRMDTSNKANYWGPQPETVQDYIIEGEVDGKWTLLCNVTNNYQRRRVHTLPCPAPKPDPLPPPPVKPVVAPGSVSATMCNVTSPLQRWSVESSVESSAGAGASDGGVVIRSADQKLCLSFDSKIVAYGGFGNSVVARPCGSNDSTVTAWRWNAAVGGSHLQTNLTSTRCPNAAATTIAANASSAAVPGLVCGCVHPVACTACHGTDVYAPPTSVELLTCLNSTSHLEWSSLQVNDGKKGDSASVLLMTEGLCLEAPINQDAVYEAAHPPAAPPQRVQAKSDADVAAEQASVPAMNSIRVTVTSTNGVADARINEIRLYDADGVAPFPARPPIV